MPGAPWSRRRSTRSTPDRLTRTRRGCSSRSRGSTSRARSCRPSRACRRACSTSRRGVSSSRAAPTPRRCAWPSDPRCARWPPAATPRATTPRRSSMSSADSFATAETVLEVDELVKHFPLTQGVVVRRHVGDVKAVDGVSFQLRKGETLGIVGESGCGKSTLAKLLMRLEEPTSGSAYFHGENIYDLQGRALRALRRNVQIVFQHPYASLTPRMTVGDPVGEPFEIHPELAPKVARAERAPEPLAAAGLSADHLTRDPPHAAGGLRTRVGIARRVALRPGGIICDEPVSALDVSAQAQVMTLLESLQTELGLSYVFIAHDLSVVRHIADRVGVMYLGKIVEIGTEDQIYETPTHPYTQALLSAVPVPDPTVRGQRQRIILQGDPPSPANIPSGCRFRTRCWKAQDICAEKVPELTVRPGSDHPSACHFAETREDLIVRH